MKFIREALDDLLEAGLYRRMHTVTHRKGACIRIGEKDLVSFASNDYLGLSEHPEIIEASRAATEQSTGTGASRLVQGNTTLHEELEQKIARFYKTEDSLVFPTGYMANIGIISALMEDDDVIISDELNHASIIDGCRLAGATVSVYDHKDLAMLEQALEEYTLSPKTLIITESLFSMDGDVAPLQKIVALAKKHNAMTLVDDAHAIGVLGESGRGGLEMSGVEGEVDFVMGTLSKTLGAMGGFAAGSADFINYLRNRARSFIFTTSLPAGVCAAASKAIDIIETNSRPREKLWKNVRYFKKTLRTAGIRPMCEETNIIPIVIGDANETLACAAKLLAAGLFVPAIRPPTVPEGSSRLRIAITAAHSTENIDALTAALQKIAVEKIQ